MESAESGLEATREALHRVAAHVLGRRRWEVSGRFGLRAAPGGISTPMFSPDGECIRTSGATLVHEVGGAASFASISGATLRELAKFVGADIDAAYSCGDDAPDIGDPDRPINLAAEHVETIASWYMLGWLVLDTVLGRLPDSAEPATLQLWPEHFDIGSNVALPNGSRVNLGCSPGDQYVTEPYLYVGPWGADRPGEPSYWNVSFGAALPRSAVGSTDGVGVGVKFMQTGLDALAQAAAQ